MARIYESQGPRVQLRGPQAGQGFQPVQAVDMSRSLLDEGTRRNQDAARVAEQVLRNQMNDVEAFSQFSNTLNAFLFEQAEKHNENEMKLGIAEVLNGNLTVKPDYQRNFEEGVNTLADAAVKEAALSDVVAENISPAVAENHRANSPALKGWRAYGRAIGTTKKAAAQAQRFLQEFMESDQEVIPLQNEDGSTRLLAPRDAKSGPELAAALAVGQQMMVDQFDLANINPLLIAEHLTPQVSAVREAIMSNRIAAARKEAQMEAVEEVFERVGAEISIIDPLDPTEVSRLWQESTLQLHVNGRMSRGEANEAVVKLIIEHSDALGNREILETLANTPLRANDPNGPTVGDRFRPLFEAASRGMDSYEETLRNRAQKAQDDAVDDALAAHNMLLASGASPEQIAQSHAQTTALLEQLASAGSNRAANELLNLRVQGDSYNPLLAQQLQRDLAAGVMHSPESIRRLAVEGRISQSEAESLIRTLPSSASMEKVQALSKEIDTQVRGQLQFIMAESGITSTDGASVGAVFAGQMADEIKASLQQMLITNPDMSNAEIRQFILKESQSLSRDPRFRPQFDAAGNIKVPNMEPNARVLSFRNPTTGQMVRDFSQAPAAVVQSTRANSVRDFLLSPEELTQNAQAFLNGGQPTPRVRSLMSITGKDWQSFLRDQHQVRGLPFTNMSQSQAAQAAAQRAALAPASAAILTNPNATPQQRARAWNDINAARQRAANAAAARQLGGTTGPVDFQAAYDALVGKESGGDPSVLNRSGSGATGLGQVMPENIGPWTERWLGRRMTQEEFRRNPEAQRRVVSAQFRQNIQDQIAAGHSPEMALRRAAAIWYSGRAELHNDTRPQSWNGNPYPSIKEYVDDIVNRYNSNRSSRQSFRQGRGAPQAVYTVDSLGYGSTGPHIDVKPVRPGTTQTDQNLRYTKGTLDRFVEIALPNGRRGPLSALSTTTDDDARHRARGSFGHDYAAERGSRVYLKNGARVVGNFKGDGGTDHLIIELPDGRRFQFLHGTKIK
jgi:hypothetical protein